MKRHKGLLLILILGFALSLIGLKYRLRQYKEIPYEEQNFDEVGYLWLGKSLLSTGVPANWSALNFYNQFPQIKTNSMVGFNIADNGHSPSLSNWSSFKNPLVLSTESKFDDRYASQFLMVQPYLDNPPLSGIIFALVDPGKTVFTNTVKNIRLVPIVTLSLTIVTVLLLGLFLFNFKVGIISALIYTFGPGFIISSRMAVPENLLSALLPLTLLIFFFYQKKKKWWLLALSCLLCIVSVWIKVSGLIIPLTIAIIAFNQKKYHTGWIITFSAAIGFLGYIGYGLFYNSNLFIQMLSTQGSRMFNGPVGMLAKILHPEIPSPFFDGWIILGYLCFLGVLFISKKTKNLKYLTLSVFSYLIFFTLFGGINFPWYQFIIYPILALLVGVVINHFLVKPRIEFNLLFFLIVVSTLLEYSQYTTNWITFLNSYRLLLAILVLLSAIGWFVRPGKKLLLRASLFLMLLLSLYLSVKIINNLNYLWPLLTQNKINIF